MTLHRGIYLRPKLVISEPLYDLSIYHIATWTLCRLWLLLNLDLAGRSHLRRKTANGLDRDFIGKTMRITMAAWPPKASNAFCRFSTVVSITELPRFSTRYAAFRSTLRLAMTSAWLANSETVACNLQNRALILACAAKRTACSLCSPACWERAVAFSCASAANLAAS